MQSRMKVLALGALASIGVLLVGLMVVRNSPDPGPPPPPPGSMMPVFKEVSMRIEDPDYQGDFVDAGAQFEAELAKMGMSKEQRFGIKPTPGPEPIVEKQIRVPGAYYPDEAAKRAPARGGGSMAPLVGAVVGGGFVVMLFGGVGLVLFRKDTPESVEPSESSEPEAPDSTSTEPVAQPAEAESTPSNAIPEVERAVEVTTG